MIVSAISCRDFNDTPFTYLPCHGIFIAPKQCKSVKYIITLIWTCLMDKASSFGSNFTW